MRSLRSIFVRGLGVAILLLAVSAVALRLSGYQIASAPPGPLPASLHDALISGDSLAVASYVRHRCFFGGWAQKRGCYEGILMELVDSGRVRLAMTSLELLGNMDRSVLRQGHEFTHMVGIAALKPETPLGPAFESCTGLYQSGCYHGVVQAYLMNHGVDSTQVAGLCDQVPLARTNIWLRFQCDHGVGHGLEMVYQLNLPRALAGCDLLPTPWDRESCYGGAFMENIVGARESGAHIHLVIAAKKQPGADPAMRPAEDEHAEHMQMVMPAATASTYKLRNPADPLYPCSILEDRYRSQCYGMQAGLMAESLGSDFAKIAKACDGAPPNMRAQCYQGIGTYVSGFTVRDHGKAIELCSLGSLKYQPWCFVGVAKNLVDVTSNPDDGIAFCHRVGLHLNKVLCFYGMGQEIALLKPLMTDREQACTRVVEDYRLACRFGTGNSLIPPPDLPRAEGSE